MLKFFSVNHRRAQLRAGFTLIELLVVIAIIGILASIVVASLNTARKKSRDARRIADIKQVQLALELYYDAAKGVNGLGTTASYPGGVLADLAVLNGTYIPKVPVDPTGSGIYVYAYQGLNSSTGGACANNSTSACLFYHLGAVLEDTGNPALKADADSALGFDGGHTDCVATSGTDACYDVTP